MNLLLYFLFILHLECFARQPLGPERYQSLTGKSMQKDIKGQWDLLYGRTGFVYGKKPVKFLAENFHLIATKGSVLDVGMGEGRNAVYLATKGFQVTGIDISSAAIKKAEALASEYQVQITAITSDASKYHFKKNSFDAVLCFYYVDRALLPVLIDLIKPGGYLFYEAYTIDQKKLMGSNPADEDAFFLKNGELQGLLKGLKIVKYEEGISQNEAKASAIARK